MVFISLLFIKERKLFLVNVISVLLLFISLLVWKHFVTTYQNEVIQSEIKIISKSQNYYLIEYSNKRYVLFRNSYDFDVGDKILATFSINNFNNESKNFWYSKFVFGFIKLKNYFKTEFDLSWIERFFNLNFFNRESYKNMTLPLLFGKYDSDSNILDISRSLGIVHLIVISGFHFNIIFTIFKKIFVRLKFNFDVYLPLLILSIYFIFVNFSVSTLRAYIYIVLVNFINLVKIREKDKFYFVNQKLFVVFITLLISLIINPFFIFTISFWYSYLITIVILVFRKIEKTKKKIFLNKISIFFYCYCFSLLISLTNQNDFNILSIFNIFIFSFVIEFSIILNLIFWFIPDIIDFYYLFFKLIFNFFNIVNVTLTTDFHLNLNLVLYLIFNILISKLVINNLNTT